MSVYVDDARHPAGRMRMSHMLADSDAELRAMAQRIGVSETHHQGDHFDICQTKRAAAVALGAVEISQREAVRVRRRVRSTVQYTGPETLLFARSIGRSRTTNA